jgi:uncharacterized protein (DUF58 family)
MKTLRDFAHVLRTRLLTFATRRSIRLTSEGVRFLLFTLGIGIAAINTGNNLFYLLLALMLSLIVVSGLLSEQCIRKLTFHRHIPDLILANDPAMVSLSVTNQNRWFPGYSLRLFDVSGGKDLDRGLFVPYLEARRSVLLSYPLLATKRGRITLEQLRAETLFPFGLFLKRALYPVETMVLVGPPIKQLSLRFVEDLVGQGQGHPLPRRGHGTQLYNLRLYRPGDDSRSIHWMTTARTAQLIVRETEIEDQRRVTVVLSPIAPDHLDGLFERTVTFTASLLWQLSERQYPLRLIVGADDSGMGVGADHLLSMMKVLAICRRHCPDGVGSQASRARRGDLGRHESGYIVALHLWPEGGPQEHPFVADRVLGEAQLEELTRAF